MQSVSLAWRSLCKCAREELGKQRDAEEDRKSINDVLPSEMLAHVLSFCDPARDLRRVCLVCHLWNDIAWDAVDLAGGNNFVIREASRRGCVEAVRRLLTREEVNPADCQGGLIKRVLDVGAPHYLWYELGRPVKKHKEVLLLLLADGRVDPSVNNNRLLYAASSFGWTDIVELLLADNRVDLSADDNMAICAASARGQTAVVALLISDARVNPDARSHEPLRRAEQNGHTKVVKILRASARVNAAKFDKEEREKEECATMFLAIVVLILWFFG